MTPPLGNTEQGTIETGESQQRRPPSKYVTRHETPETSGLEQQRHSRMQATQDGIVGVRNASGHIYVLQELTCKYGTVQTSHSIALNSSFINALLLVNYAKN